MIAETSKATTVGFRHVIEDGLSILESKEIPIDRREYVLEDLIQFFKEAALGSDLVARDSLFVRSDERSAYESFSLLDKYIGAEDNQNLRERLRAAEEALERLLKNNRAPQRARKTAIQLLTELLSQIKREGGKEIPFMPKQLEL